MKPLKKEYKLALPIAGTLILAAVVLNSNQLYNYANYRAVPQETELMKEQIKSIDTESVYTMSVEENTPKSLEENINAGEVTAPVNNENAPVDESKSIKIGLLLDTSNSMDGLIAQAQSQLWKIVNELATAECDGLKPTLDIALYEYGNDGLSAREGYIRMVTPLTNDLDQISSDLFSLETNGGSEFCGYAIQSATNQLDWGMGDADLKLIFIAGNEPFDQGRVSPVSACNKAKAKGITINTIFCGDMDEGINSGWLNGAKLTAGHFMSISHNSKTVYIETPYDDKIDQLNTSLNDTYIPYGGQGLAKKSMQIAEDSNSESYGKGNKVSRIISKNSHVYKNSTWDLVDAKKEKDFDIKNIDEKTLPEEMRNMNDDDKLGYISVKETERSEINKEISDLNTKRLKYIAEQKKTLGESQENSLDQAMIEAIKEQASKKSFVFKQ